MDEVSALARRQFPDTVLRLGFRIVRPRPPAGHDLARVTHWRYAWHLLGRLLALEHVHDCLKLDRRCVPASSRHGGRAPPRGHLDDAPLIHRGQRDNQAFPARQLELST